MGDLMKISPGPSQPGDAKKTTTRSLVVLKKTKNLYESHISLTLDSVLGLASLLVVGVGSEAGICGFFMRFSLGVLHG